MIVLTYDYKDDGTSELVAPCGCRFENTYEGFMKALSHYHISK